MIFCLSQLESTMALKVLLTRDSVLRHQEIEDMEENLQRILLEWEHIQNGDD